VLTASEIAVLKAIRESPQLAIKVAQANGLISSGGKRNRELQELEEKLSILGFRPPWRDL